MCNPIWAVLIGAIVLYFDASIRKDSHSGNLVNGVLYVYITWICLAVIYFVGKWFLSVIKW